MKVASWSSKRPVLTRSAMMMGLEVAPLTPLALFFSISLGSTESSQTVVPVSMRDWRPVLMVGFRVGVAGRGSADCTRSGAGSAV